jgi:PAS domain S-box-containing protein
MDRVDTRDNDDKADNDNTDKTRDELLIEIGDLRDAADAHARDMEAVFGAVADPVVVYDRHKQVVWCNAAFRGVVATYSQDPRGATLQDRAEGLALHDVHGALLPTAQSPQNRMLRGETLSGPSAIEASASSVQGEEVWWSVTGAPLRANDGTISGAVVVLTDITARKQAEAELRRSNERFQLAERAANGFIYEWDVPAGTIYRTVGLERLLGYRLEEVAPSWAAWAQLVYLGDWQVNTDAEALAHVEALPGETLESEYRVRHRDGHYLTVAEYALIERDANGTVTRLIGQVHDISGRKRADEALRASEERLRLLIESAEEYSIFTLDTDGVINSWNEGARQMFGWSAEEIISQPSAVIFTPEDRAAGAPAQELATALKTGRAPDERFHLRKDGSRFYVSGVVSPIHDGQLQGFVKIARDLTERKAAEEALQRAHDELEQRVAERTHQLASANQQLRRLSQRILEVQENERRLIARELHDEIGQQLTGAKMLLDSLNERLHDLHQKSSSDRAQRDQEEQAALESARDLRGIVGQTLEDVRSLSLELRPAVLDSLGLIAALQWLFERYTKQSSIQVDFSADGPKWRLPQQLEAVAYRIIQEALTNVARYANVSTVTVQLYITAEALSLYVVDAGAGFDVEETLAAGDSTGLGGMRERAELLGGTLTISSLPGEGTTLHAEFSIPRVIADEAAHETEQVDGRSPEQEAARHKDRDELRDRARDQWRDQWRDAGRDAHRDTVRDVLRDSTRDMSRDTSRDTSRDAARDALHDQQEERKESEP